MKPRKRKLAVAREVIRQLEVERLVHVAGGARPDTLEYSFCNNTNDFASCVLSRVAFYGC